MKKHKIRRTFSLQAKRSDQDGGRFVYYIKIPGESYQQLSLKHSLKVYNHSPDGFDHGYAGSGPAQLALAVLMYIYRDNEQALRDHQEFKWMNIASLPEDEEFETKIMWSPAFKKLN